MPSNNKNDRKIKVPNQVNEFTKISFKSFRKGFSYTENKKEARKEYYDYLIDLLPQTVDFLVRYGHLNDEKVQAKKAKIYHKLSDPKFVARIIKFVKTNGNDGLELLPIVLKDIMLATKRHNDAEESNGGKDVYDVSDWVELAKVCLKKKLKKMEKRGIPKSTAFDLLCIIPDERAVSINRFYRVRAINECLYEHAKTEEIPYADIMKVLIDKDLWGVFITFALLERKDRFTKLTEMQQKLYITMTTWCFEQMNGMSAKDIEEILRIYISSRKRDELKNKDSARRYTLTLITEDEYPKLAKVIRALIQKDNGNEKYLS